MVIGSGRLPLLHSNSRWKLLAPSLLCEMQLVINCQLAHISEWPYKLQKMLHVREQYHYMLIWIELTIITKSAAPFSIICSCKTEKCLCIEFYLSLLIVLKSLDSWWKFNLLFLEFSPQLCTCSFSGILVKLKDMGRFSFNGLFTLFSNPKDSIIILETRVDCEEGISFCASSDIYFTMCIHLLITVQCYILG